VIAMQHDVERFNLLNLRNIIKPNYDLSNKEVYIELYISKEKKLYIIGKIDNNYICWCSLTNIADKEDNAKIFDHIANNNFTLFSTEQLVLGKQMYEEIRKWYNCTISRASYEDMLWYTPFGCYYGKENRETHGKSFSHDIESLFNELLELSEFRSANRGYVSFLEYYLDLLRKDNDYRYYYKMKPVISILEKESYLKICPDDIIRELYLKCMNECSSLYGRCMSVER